MNIVFDFDSTLLTIESLDFIISNVSGGKFDRQIEEITNQGMNGEIDLKTSIQRRLNICQISKNAILEISQTMPNFLTDGIAQVIERLHTSGHKVFIVSGGLIDAILPVAKRLNIPRENCMANGIFFNNDGTFAGLNLEIPLLYKNGKSNALQKLGILNNQTVMIGDGFTDLEVHINNPQVKFIGFGVNIVREVVKNRSMYFAKTMQEFTNILNQMLTER